MKRLAIITLLLIIGIYSNAQMTKVYRVIQTERVKDIERDTLYSKIQLLQVDYRTNSTLVIMYEFNTRRAIITDANKFIKCISSPYYLNIDGIYTDHIVLSDSIKVKLSKYYNINKSRITKINNL